MIINELWGEIMKWMASSGEEDVAQNPGLWYKKTVALNGIGPLDVRLNPHREEIDNIPSFHIRITVDDRFPGIIGIFGPQGGTIVSSRTDGEDENGLIEHFRNQPSLREATP